VARTMKDESQTLRIRLRRAGARMYSRSFVIR
jgi:hypothetical protein